MAPKAMIRYPFTITYDTSYPTGGESIASAVAGSPYSVLRVVDNIDIQDSIAPGGTGGFSAGDIAHGIVDYTAAAQKILLFINGTQVSNGTNSSLIILRCVAEGYL